MKFRRSLLAVAAIGLLFGGSCLMERASQNAVSLPRLVADGADPMPKPRPTRKTAIAAGQAAPGVLVADGADPMPQPRPPRQLA